MVVRQTGLVALNNQDDQIGCLTGVLYRSRTACSPAKPNWVTRSLLFNCKV